VNGFSCRASGDIQRRRRKSSLNDRRDSHSTPWNKETNKENTMLRNFTAGLIAAALVAGPALAAQPSNDAGAAPAAAAAAPANTKGQATTRQTDELKPAKTVKHARAHVSHHVAHLAKPAKAAKAAKTVKSSA
jgi:hypothetical protein